MGGILLGTGGLVKAYSDSCTLGIEKAGIVEKYIAQVYKIELSYAEVDKFKYYAKNNDIIILNEEYLENVILEIGIRKKDILNNLTQKDMNVRNIQFLKEIYV